MRRVQAVVYSSVLVGCLVSPGLATAPPAVAEDAETLTKAHQAETDAYIAKIRALIKTDEYKALAEKGDREALMELRSSITPVDGDAWTKKFWAGATEHDGTDGAIPYLTWLAMNDRSKEGAAKVADTVLANHAASDALLPLAEKLAYLGRTLGNNETIEFCGQLIEQNNHAEVQAHAYMTRGSILQRRDDEASKAQAEEDMARVSDLVPGTILAMRAEAPKFERERLQIGMVAPDIAGEDIDGVKFKLSDYRGKVVVIDFWGDW